MNTNTSMLTTTQTHMCVHAHTYAHEYAIIYTYLLTHMHAHIPSSYFIFLTGFFFLPRFWIAIKCLYILMCIFLKMSFSSAITPRPVSVTLVGTCAIFPQILGPILLLVLSICLYPHNTAFHIFISRPSFCLHFSCFSLDLQ